MPERDRSYLATFNDGETTAGQKNHEEYTQRRIVGGNAAAIASIMNAATTSIEEITGASFPSADDYDSHSYRAFLLPCPQGAGRDPQAAVGSCSEKSR